MDAFRIGMTLWWVGCGFGVLWLASLILLAIARS